MTRGRLTARERVDVLIDTDSFVEYGVLAGRTTDDDDHSPADGLVCGGATVHGTAGSCWRASDRSVLDGTQSDRNQRKMARMLQIAERGTLAGGAVAGRRRRPAGRAAAAPTDHGQSARPFWPFTMGSRN